MEGKKDTGKHKIHLKNEVFIQYTKKIYRLLPLRGVRSCFPTFIEEAMQHAESADLLLDIPKIQKHAARPALKDIFGKGSFKSKKIRNEKIKGAYEKHGYTLREIGQHLQLNSDYLSRLLIEMRKRSEGRLVPPKLKAKEEPDPTVVKRATCHCTPVTITVKITTVRTFQDQRRNP